MVDELTTSQETYEEPESADEALSGEAPVMPEDLEGFEEAEEPDEGDEFGEVEGLVGPAVAEDPEEPAAADGFIALAEAEGAEAEELVEDYGQKIIVDADEAPEKEPIPLGTKVAGAAKMVGGAALAAAAVPLVVVPIAPTSLMAVGGVTLAAKGQREFSGREISQIEVKAEAATEKITKVTKNTTGGLLSRLGEASTRAAQKLSETDWDEKLGLNEE